MGRYPNQIAHYRVSTLCCAMVFVGARLATAQFSATPPAPAAPPAPPSATISNPGQPQFSATPVMMMKPPNGAAGSPGSPSGAAVGGFPGASIVVVPTMTQPNSSSQNHKLWVLVPVGTKILLSLQRAVNARTAHVGDTVYFRFTFPAVAEHRVVIPAGAYVQGQIDSIHPFGLPASHVAVQMRLTTLIFSDGRVISIPSPAFNSPYASTVAGQSTRIVARNHSGTIPQNTSLELTLKLPLRIPQPQPTLAASPIGAGQQPVFIPFSVPTSAASQSPTAKTSGTGSASSTSRYIKNR